jgi:methylmalonyl-CoA mutase N-terminal domain/subunit
VAFTLANGIAYVEAAIARGLPVDSFAPRISFFFNAHSNFFEEIAKFRAARSLWRKSCADRFGARDPRSARMRFHTQTAGSTLTAQQPTSTSSGSPCRPWRGPGRHPVSPHQRGRRGSRAPDRAGGAARAPHAAGDCVRDRVRDVADPLGGSALVEEWTEELRSRARKSSRRSTRSEARGRDRERWVQREIEEAAYVAQRESRRGARISSGRTHSGRTTRHRHRSGGSTRHRTRSDLPLVAFREARDGPTRPRRRAPRRAGCAGGPQT